MPIFLCFSLFFLSPYSPFEEVKVPILGKTHRFPKQIYQNIVPANEEDVFSIYQLSENMPFLYINEESSKKKFIAFRTYDQYLRLISGVSVQDGVTHLFFVFKDHEGDVQGYMHGMVFLFSDIGFKATINEVVVASKWKGKGIGRALIGKFLSSKLVQTIKDPNAISIVLRQPFAKKMAHDFGVIHQDSYLDTSLIVNNMLSRFSLAYLMQETSNEILLHQKTAEQLKERLIKAIELDRFSVPEAVDYLNTLVNLLYQQTNRHLTDHKGDSYIGMQNDYLDLANAYFALYILKSLFPKKFGLEKEEKERQKENAFFNFKEHDPYLQNVVNALKRAQREGGLLPGNIQFVLARLFALVPFLSEEERKNDVKWVQMSILEYLRVLGLPDRKDVNIFIFPPLLQLAMTEILWFSYEYEIAKKISAKLYSVISKQKRILRKMTHENEKKILELYKQIQKELWQEEQILLKPEFGLLFLYFFNLHSEKQKGMHYKIGTLFSKASFYHQNAVNLFAPIREYVYSIEENEKGYRKRYKLKPSQIKRVKRILKELFKPVDVAFPLPERIAASL